MSKPLAKVFIIAHVSSELEQPFLQHLRDFDVAHPGCHFEVGVDAPDVTIGQMIERLRVEPGLTFTTIFERERKGPTVHILNYGHPLCGFSDTLPCDWPPGNKWVGLDEKADANCADCLAAVEKRTTG